MKTNRVRVIDILSQRIDALAVQWHAQQVLLGRVGDSGKLLFRVEALSCVAEFSVDDGIPCWLVSLDGPRFSRLADSRRVYEALGKLLDPDVEQGSSRRAHLLV
jgi:hypothetical protein